MDHPTDRRRPRCRFHDPGPFDGAVRQLEVDAASNLPHALFAYNAAFSVATMPGAATVFDLKRQVETVLSEKVIYAAHVISHMLSEYSMAFNGQRSAYRRTWARSPYLNQLIYYLAFYERNVPWIEKARTESEKQANVSEGKWRASRERLTLLGFD